jgi:hypothetical protein
MKFKLVPFETNNEMTVISDLDIVQMRLDADTIKI